jgi:hypothetical protein
MEAHRAHAHRQRRRRRKPGRPRLLRTNRVRPRELKRAFIEIGKVAGAVTAILLAVEHFAPWVVEIARHLWALTR